MDNYHAGFIFVFVCFIIAVIVFLLATIQESRLAAKATAWPVVESRVVDRLTAAPDPVAYNIRVSYLFDGKKYGSVARNFYRKETTNKHVGDTVLIKVNPRNRMNAYCFRRSLSARKGTPAAVPRTAAVARLLPRTVKASWCWEVHPRCEQKPTRSGRHANRCRHPFLVLA